MLAVALQVPAGAVSMTLGALLVIWQALGRTVFAGPAGARPLPAKSWFTDSADSGEM